MECKARRCKSDRFTQSRFLRTYGYCPDCETHTELTDEDFKTLEAEGGLLYREREVRIQEPQKKTSQTKYKKKTSKSTPKRITIPAQKLGKAPSRKVTKGPKEPPKKKQEPKKKTAPKKKPKQKLTSCPEHPTYGVVRAPRTDCGTCWSLYEAKHPLRAEKYLRKKRGASS